MGETRFGKLGQLQFKKSIFFNVAAVATLCFLTLYATTPAVAATITVTSRTDGGTGSLRKAIVDAVPGDIITFSATVFPPANPATIKLLSGLPEISKGNLTIDASNAGLILDGQLITTSGVNGLNIASSGNIIKGLQIVRFSGNGIAIYNGAKNNQIGGDWQVGSAPRGEGNIITLNGGDGVSINGTGTDNNAVSGNLIGLDADGTRDIRIQTMAISPNYADDRTLFIGTIFHGLWKTTDGGATWQEANGGLTIPDIRSLAVSPNFANDGTLFAGTAGGGIFKTTDGGASWSRVDGGMTTSTIRSLVISPAYSSAGHVFAVAEGSGVFASTDGGVTWAARNNGLSAIPSFVVISPNYGTDGTIFGAGNGDSIFKSVNQGNSWTAVNAGMPGGIGVMAISPNYSADKTLFAPFCANNNSFWKSTDGGNTWASLGVNPGWCEIRGLAVSPNYSVDKILFVADRWGNTYKSTDGGNTWMNTNTAGTQNVTLAISPAYATDQTLFIGTAMAGVFKSADGGGSWTQVSAGLTERGNSGNGVRIQWGANGNTIGGNNPGKRNVISHNYDGGISIHDGSNNNIIIGNYIGTDAGGLKPLGNSNPGIRLWGGVHENIIGGTTANERNVISGNNGDGVSFSDSQRNAITGNYIGTDHTGAAALGNSGNGISLASAQGNVIGGTTPAERNVIAYNRYNGIGIGGENSVGNTISRNAIFGHTSPGIDNNNGGNTELPPPVFTNVTAASIDGIAALPNLTIEIFSDDADEGRIYEGTAISDGNGAFTLSKPGGVQGPFLTATATDADGNTSEFSTPRAAVKEATQYALTITKSGFGAGTVTSTQPVLIACGAICSGTLNTGTVVTLAAAADNGSLFSGWTGACTGSQTSCSVTMSAAQTVTAQFTSAAGVQHLLTVAKTGTGSGSITSNQEAAGINCGNDCAKIYDPLPTAGVTLTATPAAGSTFGSWSGACSGSATSCVIAAGALDVSPLHVTALFTSTDATPPASLGNLMATPTINVVTNNNTIHVSWTEASDAGSGLAGYSFVWDTNAATDPDNTVDATRTSTISPALANGTGHWFHIRAVDNAGNAGATIHLGPFMIDTAYTPPARSPGTIMVTSRLDSGPGSLRQAMLDAVSGDVITFDTTVFPPANPATISLISALPNITQGNLTIDARDAGVILDGRWNTSGMSGLRITSSGNIIKGLQIVRIPGYGIEITNGAKNNQIGGDWQTGSAPRGEGNIITLNGDDGVSISGTGTDNNTVSGNLIGLDADGTRDIRTQALAISPNYGSDKTLFIGTKFNGVLRSTDGGITWVEMNNGITIPDVSALAISTAYASDGAIFAGTANGGIFRSTNGGAAWMRVDGSVTDKPIKSLAISPSYANDRQIFAGTDGYGVLASSDGGSTWEVRNNSGSAGTLLISPNYAVDRTLFVGLLKSVDQGNTWALATNGLTNVNVNTLAISPNYAVDRTLFAGLQNCNGGSMFMKSADDGATWTPLGGTDNSQGLGCDVTTIAFSPNYGTDHTLFGSTVGGGAAVSKSVDGGATWIKMYSSEYNGNRDNRLLAVSPVYGEDQTIFLGYLGLFKSVNGGGWTDVSAGMTERGNSGIGVRISNDAHGNTIGGNSAGKRNVISHNSDYGIEISNGSDNNTIIGNYIGTDASGAASLGNGNRGVALWSNVKGNRIGGMSPGERNIISGNRDRGVTFDNAGVTNNTVTGNYIGLNAAGTAALGNANGGIAYSNGPEQNKIVGNVVSGNTGDGVNFNNSHRNVIAGNYIGTDPAGAVGIGNTASGVSFWDAQGNVIGGMAAGQANVIAYNQNNGISVGGGNSVINTISQNAIFSNTNYGIDNNAGGNTEFPPPVFTNATASSVAGIVALPNLTIEIFSDDADEGRIYEGTVISDGSGAFSLSKSGGFQGPYLTATATDADGNTSEFSSPRAAINPATPYLLTVNKSGTGTGRVTSTQPVLIACGAICSGTLNAGTAVTLAAAADDGSLFSGWTGACTGAQTSCTVTMSAARTVTAQFTSAAAVQHLLTVAKAGTGTGTVTSNQEAAGINCGNDCSKIYDPLPAGGVTLTATPAAGSTFGGWSGACSGNATTCVIAAGSLDVLSLEVMATFTSSDSAPPVLPGNLLATPTINALTNDNTIHVSWTEASDAGSGLAGYSFVWDTNAATEPDKTVETTRTSTVSPALSNGTNHWFHIRAVDNAGNAGATVHLGPFIIDTAYTPPQRTPTTIIVTSRVDSGPGSLRQALLDAVSGDVITFDTTVFPPASPATITPIGGLPEISMGNLTIDASNAGVILDGRWAAAESDGLRITSNGNIIKGLQIVRFSDNGIEIASGAKNNQIGGDWQTGSAPRGEGNIITMNGSDGVNINGTGTASNTVSGNLIGLDADGTRDIRTQALALSPNYGSDKTLFIGTKFNGIWKTTDGGATWQEANGGLTITDVRSLAVSPNFANDRTVFAGTTSGGIFKTMNGGGSWTRVDGSMTTADITGLTISPNYSTSNHIFATTAGSGIFASTNGGATWAARNNGLTNTWPTGLLISPNYGVDQTLYAFAWNTLFESIDQGNSWTLVSNESFNNIVTLAISPNFANDRIMLAGLNCSDKNYAFLKSTDGGVSWAPSGDTNITGCHIVTIGFSPDYATDRIIFAGTGGTLSKSGDGGATWLRLNWNNQNSSLAISPAYTNDKTLFAGQSTGGVFKSVNSGDAWEDINAGLTEQGNSGSGVRISNGAQANTIGGDSAGKRNVISHNSSSGIEIVDGSNNIITGNYIGTDANGAATLGNGFRGVKLWSDAKGNLIGGTSPGERNVISGNRDWGVTLENTGATNNTIAGNYVGLNAAGTAALGNAGGIGSWNGPEQNRITGNVVGGNNGDGIHFNNSHRNVIAGNYIGTDPAGAVVIGNIASGVSFGGGAQGNVVGGTTPAERNVISGNVTGVGFWSAATMSNTVIGNYIGPNASGTAALGNGTGVLLNDDAQQNRVGGATANERNVISGNIQDGVQLNGGDGNTIIGNYIGTDATGAGKLGNGGQGVNIFNDSHQNVIGGTAAGQANVIAYNLNNGVNVNGNTSIGNAILRNSIFGHTSPGIENNSGGNTELSPPVILNVTATSVSGIAPMADIAIEIFSDDVDEGRIYEGTATSDAGGEFSLTKAGGFQGPYLTATATDADGNTSEFSAPRAVIKETIQYALTVAKAGAGKGTVASTQPVLIACGAVCSGSFNTGTAVTLSATADSGSEFGGWSGACSGAQSSCTVTMGAAKTVTATFNPVVTETTPPTNAGIVINGGAASTTSRQVTLTLSATDASGMGKMRFSNDNKVNWSDPVSFAGAYTWNLSPGDGEKTVWVKFSDSLNNWMTDANAVFATITFSAPLTITYTLTAAKTGAGVIASNPSGISCGATCSAAFNSGQSVTLTATPEAGSTFAGWSGDCSGTATTCTLAMYGNRTATAAFTVAQTDTAPPTNASIVINSGATATGSRQVTLTLSASDPLGMGQMQFSNDDKVTWYSAVPFAGAYPWNLSQGDGVKRVWAKFSDSLNNWMTDANAVSATITYLAPTTGVANPTGLMVVEAGAAGVTLKWTKNLEEGVTYDLFRSQTVNGIFYRVNTAPIGATADSISWEGGVFKVNFTDKGLKEGQTYYYKVRAFANGATSPGFSDLVNAKTQTINDYLVNVPDPTNIVSIGNSVKYYIQILPRDRFKGTLNLSCSDIPDGLIYDFIVNGESKGSIVTGLTPPASVVLQVSAGNATVVKEHTFHLLAQNVWLGGSSNYRSTPLSLTVLSRDGAGIHVEVEKTVLRKGEKVRIYGSILPMEEGRTVTLNVTPEGGSARTQNVRTAPGGKFEDADWISTLGMGTYTVTTSWTDGMSNQHVSAARTFTVEKGQPVLTCLRKTNVQAISGIEFPITGKMTPAVPYAPLTMRIENPDGGVTDQTIALDGDGQYDRLENYFTKNGIWKLRVYFAGNDEYIGAESNELVVPVGVDFGRAIILGGGDAAQSNTYWEVTKKLTVAAYRDFKAKGFRNDMIYYLINTPDIDINYDGISDKVVNVSAPTAEAFLDAVRGQFASVLNPDTPLFIYMQGHGTNDGRLQISGMQDYLTVAQLKDALDYLQGAGNYAGRPGSVTANVVIIIEACYSGSFIPPLSGQNRVILTSAGGEPYNTDSTGQIAFSRRLFAKLLEGDNFKKAFEYARTMQINMNYPAPQLDDNGDGASNASDGLLASNLYLNGQLTWGLKPSIGAIDVAQNLENGISTPISVLVFKGDVNIDKVWVQIIAPNANIGGGEDTITYPEIILTKDEASGLYKGMLTDLRISGMYKLLILASDANKEIADPVITYLAVVKNAKPGDINGDESVTIADAILAMQVLSGMRPEGLSPATMSDVNGDGKIGLPEVIFILQKAAGVR